MVGISYVLHLFALQWNVFCNTIGAQLELKFLCPDKQLIKSRFVLKVLYLQKPVSLLWQKSRFFFL